MLEATLFGKSGAEGRILTAAAALFGRFGYSGVSTRDIANAAEVNEVTIYRHFPNKHDLYLAVLSSELQQINFRGDLLAQIAEAKDGRAALACTFDLIVATLMYKPNLVRLIQYGALQLSEDLASLLRKYLGELIEVVARYVEPWVSRSELRCTDAKGLVLALIAIVLSHRSLQRLFPGDVVSPESLFEAYSEFCVMSQRRG
jgi:AcrR family transcriptional regulator